MSNGARHGLGALIGVIVTPIIAACLTYGVSELQKVARFSLGSFRSYHGSELWIGAALMLAMAIVLGLVAGSRVSPVASLIPGAAFTGVGLLWIVDPIWMMQHTSQDPLPESLSRGYMYFGPYGIFLLLGGLLLVASVTPSRWKSLRATGGAPRFGGPPPAPMGPPPMQGAPAPMGAPQPQQAPPAPGQSPPPWQGAPQYGQPPAQQGPANPPPLPSSPPAAPAAPAADDPQPSARSDPDEDGPGEWTQMYGGGNRPQ